MWVRFPQETYAFGDRKVVAELHPAKRFSGLNKTMKHKTWLTIVAFCLGLDIATVSEALTVGGKTFTIVIGIIAIAFCTFAIFTNYSQVEDKKEIK